MLGTCGIARSSECAMRAELVQGKAHRAAAHQFLQNWLSNDNLVHFLCGKRFAAPRGTFLRQIVESALDSLQRVERREKLIPDPRNEAVLHLCRGT